MSCELLDWLLLFSSKTSTFNAQVLLINAKDILNMSVVISLYTEAKVYGHPCWLSIFIDLHDMTDVHYNQTQS